MLGAPLSNPRVPPEYTLSTLGVLKYPAYSREISVAQAKRVASGASALGIAPVHVHLADTRGHHLAAGTRAREPPHAPLLARRWLGAGSAPERNPSTWRGRRTRHQPPHWPGG
jgi:hypothetical protein